MMKTGWKQPGNKSGNNPGNCFQKCFQICFQSGNNGWKLETRCFQGCFQRIGLKNKDLSRFGNLETRFCAHPPTPPIGNGRSLKRRRPGGKCVCALFPKVFPKSNFSTCRDQGASEIIPCLARRTCGKNCTETLKTKIIRKIGEVMARTMKVSTQTKDLRQFLIRKIRTYKRYYV